MSTNRYLYFAVFSAGMTTLALELSASRLLGPYFGASNLVWASIIGLILIFLTIGYFLGGAWADRTPQPRVLYTILAWSSFTSGLLPVVARPILLLSASAFDELELGVLLGSFVAVIILFGVPITLQGMVSPFAIRLAIADSRRAGSLAGNIYAASTLGSFLGTFLPVLVLTPAVGTTYTFLIFSIFLNLVALTGLWLFAGRKSVLPWLWMPLVLAALAVWFARGPLKTTSGQIFEAESAYNYIEVLEMNGYRYLRLNEGQGIHSMWHADDLDYGGPWQQFLAAPFFNAPPYSPSQVESMAIVGLAAGTTARQATAVFGGIAIDGFEIDPEIITVGREYFSMDLPNLNAYAIDGRVGLAQSNQQYSIIGVDAYRPPYIPWHLTTREFFELCRAHLRADGVLVINVGRSPTDRRLVDGLASTIGAVFPSVYVVDVPETFNAIIYATVMPTDSLNLFVNLGLLTQAENTHPLLLSALDIAAANLKPTAPAGLVYTDDFSPIEWITNDMILDFILTGQVETLR